MRKVKILSRKTCLEVIRKYRLGTKRSTLAQEYDVSPSTITRVIFADKTLWDEVDREILKKFPADWPEPTMTELKEEIKCLKRALRQSLYLVQRYEATLNVRHATPDHRK